VEDAPRWWCEFGDEPFGAATMAGGHIGPSKRAAVDAGDQGYFGACEPIGNVGGQAEGSSRNYPVKFCIFGKADDFGIFADSPSEEEAQCYRRGYYQDGEAESDRNVLLVGVSGEHCHEGIRQNKE